MDDTTNPYQSPTSFEAPIPLWRRIVSTLLILTAIPTGVLALLMAIGGVRWLIIETLGGARSAGAIFGFELSLGQALMLGAGISTGAALSAWLAAGRVRRPRRSPES